MGFFVDDDKYIGNVPETISDLVTNDEAQDEKISLLEQKINQALAGVFHYKGSVATYSDLPASDNEVGDTYNVLDTGANYAWDGSGWDELGSTIDTSVFAVKNEDNSFSGINVFNNDVQISNIGSISIDNAPIDFYDSGHSNLGSKIIFDPSTYRLSITDVLSSKGISVDVDDNILLPIGNTDLGDSSYPFDKAYINEIDIPVNASLTGKIVNVGSYYLGIKINTDNLVLFDANYSGGSVNMTNLLPLSNNSRDIGSATTKWKDLYISGNAYLEGNDLWVAPQAANSQTYTIHLGYAGAATRDWQIRRASYNFQIYNQAAGGNIIDISSGGNINFLNNISPSSDNTSDLGTSSKKLKDIYLAGNLSDGTNSATATEIAALVAYAKAQGWIS